MAHSHRRQFLKDFLGTLAKGAGSIVLAAAATARALGQPEGDQNTDIQKRAENLAGPGGAEGDILPCNFANRAFRNARAGGFGGGAFRNAAVGGGGAFRNGGFANGGGFGGGAFRNGAFRNW
jgi:hypothetical protein